MFFLITQNSCHSCRELVEGISGACKPALFPLGKAQNPRKRKAMVHAIWFGPWWGVATLLCLPSGQAWTLRICWKLGCFLSCTCDLFHCTNKNENSIKNICTLTKNFKQFSISASNFFQNANIFSWSGFHKVEKCLFFRLYWRFVYYSSY